MQALHLFQTCMTFVFMLLVLWTVLCCLLKSQPCKANGKKSVSRGEGAVLGMVCVCSTLGIGNLVD